MTATTTPPAYYMVNCAHPTHFIDHLDPAAAWVGRIHGIRANASTMSHAELDAATNSTAAASVSSATTTPAWRPFSTYG